MRTTLRIVAFSLTAAALLSFAAGSASASRAIRIENPAFAAGGTIVINESLGVARITCASTLRATFAPQIEKASAGRLPEGQIGILNEWTTANCRDNFGLIWTVIFLTPIPVRYNSFLGTLPEITGILVTALRAGVRIMRGETNCLFQGDIPILLGEPGGLPRLTQKRFLSNRLNYLEGTCGRESWIEISGTMEISRPFPLLNLVP